MLSESDLNHWIVYWDDGWRYGILRKLTEQRAHIEHPVKGKLWREHADVRLLGDDFDATTGKFIGSRVQASQDTLAEGEASRVRSVRRVRRKNPPVGAEGEECLKESSSSGTGSASVSKDSVPSTDSKYDSNPQPETSNAKLVGRKKAPSGNARRKSRKPNSNGS